MAIPFLQRQLHIKFTVAQLLLLSGWLLMLAYIGWEFYWYTKVDWHFVKWHTHLAPYAGLILLGITLYLLDVLKPNGLMLLLSTSGTLMAIEFIFILTSSESDITLLSEFKVNPHNVYNIWIPNSEHHLERKGEFKYKRFTNSLGFSDREWSTQKDPGKIRILTLGDSFTEGDAAPADSAYPFLLQQMLGEKVEVLNAGTCGSDPVFSYKNLEDRLLQYQPDVVVQTISSHDLFRDIALRGGFERFTDNNTLKSMPAPKWLYPAVVSHIARNVLDAVGADRHTPRKYSAEFILSLPPLQQQLINKYDSLGKKHHFKTLVLILPMRHETQWNKYDYDFNPLVNMAGATTTVKTFDLMPCYQSHIQNTTRNYQTYYWVIDAHHNSRGYHMMAQCVYEKLVTMLPSKDTSLLSAQ